MRLFNTLLLGFCLLASAYGSETCIVKLRVAESPPSYFKDENGHWTGFLAEQGAAVIREADCTVEYRSAPWGRGLRLLEEGEIDMMGLMSITEERKAFAHFIGPHYFEEQRLVVARGSDYHIEKHEDLKNLPKKIMLEPDSYMGEEMEKLKQDQSFLKNVQWTSPIALSPEMISKVTRGRVSGFISYVTPGALNKFTDEVKYHPFVITSDPVYFGLSKKSVGAALLEKLNAAAEHLKATGEFQRILSKYE